MEGGRSLRLFGNVHGLLLANGMDVRIPITGGELILLFWGHSWSGYVDIQCGSVSTSVDLYSEAGGFVRVNIENSDCAREVLIRARNAKSSRAKSDEVIFFKALDYATRVEASEGS
jgi:hypothetical protein